MGVVAGKLKHVVRPLKNYNVEERAFKAISKEKPTPAPTHKRMQDVMEEIKSDPDLLTRGRLDPKTMENLSKVFVTSKGDNPIIRSTRKLPTDRTNVLDYEYGFQEPVKVRKGKVSMKQILEILSNYDTKPNIYTPEKLANDYSLDIMDVNNLLKYYKPFQIYIPKKEKPKQTLSLKLLQQKMDQLKK